MNMNKKMEQLMKDINSLNKKQFRFNIENLSNLFSPNFVSVYDCIIISKKPVELLKENFKKALDMYSDKTGYEASNTEIRINDFVENETLSVYQGLSIVLIVIEVWSYKLKAMQTNNKFCFIFECNNNYVTLRFHKIRSEEIMWLSNELDSYENPVGYIII